MRRFNNVGGGNVISANHLAGVDLESGAADNPVKGISSAPMLQEIPLSETSSEC